MWRPSALKSRHTNKLFNRRLICVLLKIVDPQYTSQRCSQCGHVERGNRSCQARFCCKQCGHQAHADCNAARNIRARALVNAPIVSAYAAAAG
ncbi:MAG: transposase [Gemmatimonadetes bacterium]|nr:transposase [Gemmatimonadota bacterium]